jgi:hypothetical protein
MLIKGQVEQEELVLAIVIDYIVLTFLDNSYSKIIYLKYNERIYVMLSFCLRV